jgi:hypothetical protein
VVSARGLELLSWKPQRRGTPVDLLLSSVCTAVRSEQSSHQHAFFERYWHEEIYPAGILLSGCAKSVAILVGEEEPHRPGFSLPSGFSHLGAISISFQSGAKFVTWEPETISGMEAQNQEAEIELMGPLKECYRAEECRPEYGGEKQRGLVVHEKEHSRNGHQ